MERLSVDSLGNIFHARILQHRICVARADMFCHSACHGDFWRYEGILQQLLRTRTTLSANRQLARMVEEESGSEMAVVEMVQKRFSGIFHVLLRTDDIHHRSGGARSTLALADNPSAMDDERSMALGISDRD